MTHYMNLKPAPFAMIANRQKTIELRLYDEKRKLIHPGDLIIFSNTQSPENSLCVRVKKLHIFPSFEALYQALPLEKCGYLPEELNTASHKDMDAYYHPEQQVKFGVVGIELTLQERTI